MTTSPKKRPGRWKLGESDNPSGRARGSGEVAKVRAAIAARVPELLEAMMQRALDGDMDAARLLLERTVAPLKAAEVFGGNGRADEPTVELNVLRARSGLSWSNDFGHLDRGH